MANQESERTVAFKSKEDGKVVIISQKDIIDLLRDLKGLKNKIELLMYKAR